MDTLDRFDDVADDYESFLTKIPKYERIVETLFEVLEQLNRERSPDRVAELGVATGNLGQDVLKRFQPSVYYGIDGSQEMIDRASERLEKTDADVRLERTAFQDWSPPGSLDWVYSNLSVHHLLDYEKRDLFDRIQGTLNESGAFVLSDLVKVPEKRRGLYETVYRKRLRALGFKDSEIQNRWEQHLEHDVPSELRATLRWLREVGFGRVECVWKDFNRAIILAGHRNEGD